MAAEWVLVLSIMTGVKDSPIKQDFITGFSSNNACTTAGLTIAGKLSSARRELLEENHIKDNLGPKDTLVTTKCFIIER